MLNVGKSLIEITPQGTGGGGGTTPISVNTIAQGTIINGVNIEIDVDDKNGSPITTGSGALTITKVGNTINLDIAGNTSFQINTAGASGTIPNWDLFDIRLRDQLGGTIVPTSVSVSGSVITINETIPYTTPISVNSVSKGTITSGLNFEIDVDNKNGVPLTEGVDFTASLLGNILNLDIAGQTPLQINATPAGFLDNWDTIFIDVDDKNGNPITGAALGLIIVGNNIDFNIAGNTPLQVNGGASIGVVPNWDLVDIRLRDQSANVVPLVSSSISGSQVTLNINNYPAPSGVAFKVPPNGQTTQYATGATPEDEGWRWANGFWDYVAPTSPAKVAELDYTLTTGNDFWYRLQQPLVVAGISSTIRFVDVDGGQTWSTTNNKHWVTIDKLTGLMFIRLRDQAPTSQSVWQNMIDLCAALSLTVAGNTYSDWFMPSLTEMAYLFGGVRTSTNWVDAVTGGSTYIMTGSSSSWNTGVYWTATTRPDLTTAVQMHRADTTFAMFGALSQNKSGGAAVPCVPIRKCRNLITAP